MPTMPTTATPELDAFLRLHADPAGPLPGGPAVAAGGAWLCFVCWATPVAAAATDPAGR